MREFSPLDSSSDVTLVEQDLPRSNQHALTMVPLDKIKSGARKIAWTDDTSWNPFRKLHMHGHEKHDVEALSDAERSSSERGLDTTTGEKDDGLATMSTGRGESGSGEDGAANGDVVRGTNDNVVERRSSGRPPSEEQKARSRFMSRFRPNKSASNSDHDLTPSSSEGKGKGAGGRKLKLKKFTLANQLQATLFNSWINILLFAAPVGIAVHFVPSMPPAAIFAINFIAIIPLAALLSYATEEIAMRVGETLGGLLNATFGNAVELIVTIIALVQNEITIVKTSLIGSILSNLLLVMGMCFFFGGLRRTEQFFNETVAQTAASLLALAIASIIIPTVFDKFTTSDSGADVVGPSVVAATSRGTSIILLVVYGCYLFFQLKTHSAMYNEESKKVAARPRKHKIAKGRSKMAIAAAGAIGAGPGRNTHSMEFQPPNNDQFMKTNAHEDDDEPEEPQLLVWVAVLTLAASTAVVAVCAEFMVSSINDLTTTSGISREFVGLILLPIVGNAAEHVTAVTVAIKDKMDLAIGVAIGSSMQIALLVIPFSVILGWILGKDDMNLSFDGFQVAVMFVAILLVNYLIADGKSHWLEGVLLQCLYIIIAVTAWFYPNDGSGAAATG